MCKRQVVYDSTADILILRPGTVWEFNIVVLYIDKPCLLEVLSSTGRRVCVGTKLGKSCD